MSRRASTRSPRAKHAAADTAVAPDDVPAPAHRIASASSGAVATAGERARELDGAAGVEEARALRQLVVAVARLRGVFEDRLDEHSA